MPFTWYGEDLPSIKDSGSFCAHRNRQAVWSPLMERSTPTFLDEPPQGPKLTSYDREHMVLYLRLLDAERDGADWREASKILFGLDPDLEPDRCQRVHAAHLARAKWMSESGYRELLGKGQSH